RSTLHKSPARLFPTGGKAPDRTNHSAAGGADCGSVRETPPDRWRKAGSVSRRLFGSERGLESHSGERVFETGRAPHLPGTADHHETGCQVRFAARAPRSSVRASGFQKSPVVSLDQSSYHCQETDSLLKIDRHSFMLSPILVENRFTFGQI